MLACASEINGRWMLVIIGPETVILGGYHPVWKQELTLPRDAKLSKVPVQLRDED